LWLQSQSFALVGLSALAIARNGKVEVPVYFLKGNKDIPLEKWKKVNDCSIYTSILISTGILLKRKQGYTVVKMEKDK
jgi:hypothetical protein